jgi:cell division protein FtsW (lipid II flippase)
MKWSVDYKLFFTVLFLIIFWMIMISSVSVYWSFRVTNIMAEAWYIDKSYNYFYVLRNIWHVIVSLIGLWIIVKIKYSFFEKYSKQIFGIAIGLLITVLILWATYKWARWWISIPWVPFDIQPTEFLKLALIIFFAAFLKKYKWYLDDFHKGYIPFMWFLWIIVLLVWLQPDFGTIMVIVPVSIIMYFYAWMNIKHLLITALLWIFMIISVYSIWDYDKQTWKNLNTLWYITQRIDNFLADNEEAINNKTINYQTEQALIAIWSWWFTWLGFWWSIQKFWYLPEVQWDFIFSVIIEELWFIGWLILMFLYMYIGYRWFYIASRVTDFFAQYVSIWISSRILLQAFINIWVNLNIVPLTWITLPFVSYWWSSLLSLVFWLAILLNISRYVDNATQYSRVNRKKIMF